MFQPSSMAQQGKQFWKRAGKGFMSGLEKLERKDAKRRIELMKKQKLLNQLKKLHEEAAQMQENISKFDEFQRRMDESLQDLDNPQVSAEEVALMKEVKLADVWEMFKLTGISFTALNQNEVELHVYTFHQGLTKGKYDVLLHISQSEPAQILKHNLPYGAHLALEPFLKKSARDMREMSALIVNVVQSYVTKDLEIKSAVKRFPDCVIETVVPYDAVILNITDSEDQRKEANIKLVYQDLTSSFPTDVISSGSVVSKNPELKEMWKELFKTVNLCQALAQIFGVSDEEIDEEMDGENDSQNE